MFKRRYARTSCESDNAQARLQDPARPVSVSSDVTFAAQCMQVAIRNLPSGGMCALLITACWSLWARPERKGDLGKLKRKGYPKLSKRNGDLNVSEGGKVKEAVTVKRIWGLHLVRLQKAAHESSEKRAWSTFSLGVIQNSFPSAGSCVRPCFSTGRTRPSCGATLRPWRTPKRCGRYEVIKRSLKRISSSNCASRPHVFSN
jgi:hypothetical protein